MKISFANSLLALRRRSFSRGLRQSRITKQFAHQDEQFVGFVGGELVIGPATLQETGRAEIYDGRVGLFLLKSFCQCGAIVLRSEGRGHDETGNARSHQAHRFLGLLPGMRSDDIELGSFKHQLSRGKRAIGFLFSN